MDQETRGPIEKTQLTASNPRPKRSVPTFLSVALILSVLLSPPPDPTRADSEFTQRPRQAAVGRVIDGDTIELVNGERVRYIGIDAPEIRRKVKGRWIESPEPFAIQAFEKNRRLVGDRTVRLELDRQTRDRHNRLLAYVYAGDRFVNAELVSAGYAVVRIYPPNDRFSERLRNLETEARAKRRGLWGTGPIE